MPQTIAHGLTMNWNVSKSRFMTYVLHGYIGREERMSCQLLHDWTWHRAEKLVINRLRTIAESSTVQDR